MSFQDSIYKKLVQAIFSEMQLWLLAVFKQKKSFVIADERKNTKFTFILFS